MPGAGWSNASSPGFSGAGACWSAGSSILKTFSVSFNSLAYLSSSGNFEIGSNVEETWSFTAESGDSVQVQVQYIRGVPVRANGEATVYSAVKPDFYRIYRFEQATDVVRSAVTG